MWAKVSATPNDQLNSQNVAPQPSLSSERVSESPSLRPKSLSNEMNTGGSSTPITPPRGRPMSRYPESLGRVPLHRRGTSRTYECLEDLLREAGYKETRIFTPEAERTAGSSAEKRGGRLGTGVRGGVDAVIGFLSGLVSRSSSPVREATTPGDATAAFSQETARPTCSSPPSPLPQVRQLNGPTKISKLSSSASVSKYSHNASSESLHITVQRMRVSSALVPADTSCTPFSTKPAHNVVHSHQSLRGHPHLPHPPVPQQRLPFHRQPSKLSKSDVPNAHANLRHMASAPNIHHLNKRLSSSGISLRSQQPLPQSVRQPNRETQRSCLVVDLNDHHADYEYKREANNQDPQMPLARNWLESVTRGILPGVGTAINSDTASTKTVATQKTNSALSDRSQPRGRQSNRKPSLLSPQIQHQKARICEGQVHCARVLCRSAPTSRASSMVRTNVVEGKTQPQSNKSNRPAKSREGHPSLRGWRAKGKPKDTDIVPCLAKTLVENDEWGNRYLDEWGMDTHGDELSSDGDDDEDDDDDDDEVGLDRLLVPARRQQSIQSLRRHLHRPRSEAASNAALVPNSGRPSPFGTALPRGRNRRDWRNGSWGTSQEHEWISGQGDDGEEGYAYVFTSSKFGSTGKNNRRRQGLPGSWAQWGAAS
ncbi:hypothetical protein V8B97DRAFT_1218022 [Scleroderma yunnanense]